MISMDVWNMHDQLEGVVFLFKKFQEELAMYLHSLHGL